MKSPDALRRFLAFGDRVFVVRSLRSLVCPTAHRGALDVAQEAHHTAGLKTLSNSRCCSMSRGPLRSESELQPSGHAKLEPPEVFNIKRGFVSICL